MKTLCLAFILSQHSPQEASPPEHIQDLVKKRILYQLKQSASELKVFFDKESCRTLGSYSYMDEEILLHAEDNSMELKFSLIDLIEGRKLEMAPLVSLAKSYSEKSLNLEPQEMNSLLDRHVPLEEPREVQSSFNYKKWLPYVVGAVGLSLGGWAIYNSTQRSGGGGGSPSNQGLTDRGRQ